MLKNLKRRVNKKMLKSYTERKVFLLQMIGDKGSVITHENAPLQHVFFAYEKFCGLSRKDFKKDLLNIWKEGLIGRITTAGGGASRSEGLNPTYLYAYVGLKHDVLVSKRKQDPLFGTYQPRVKKESEIRLVAYVPTSNKLSKESFLFWDKGKSKLLCVVGNFEGLEEEIKHLTKFDLDCLQHYSTITDFMNQNNNEILEFFIKQNKMTLSLFVIKDKNNFLYSKKFSEHSLADIEYSDYVIALKEKIEKLLKRKAKEF